MRNNRTTAEQPLRANEISWILEQQFTAGIGKSETEAVPEKKETKKKPGKKKTEDK